MTDPSGKIIIWLLLVLALIQTACVSHQHRPELALLKSSLDCEIVNGSYAVDSAQESELIAENVFHTDDMVSVLTIAKTESQVTFTGIGVSEARLFRAFPDRFSCNDSILKLVLNDEGSGGGGSSYASDTVLELFALDESSLNLRFVDTTLVFLAIIPYYSSRDELITLKRQTF